MSRDVLSQGEIDSLVSALSEGGLDKGEQGAPREYETYDFRRPTKFSKEQVRTLHIIHDNYSRIMGNYLSAYLRVPARMKVASVSQATYEEFLVSLPVPTLMTIFKMAPTMGPAMLGVDPVLAVAMIVLTLGGKPEASADTRDLTEIEVTVMREINARFLDNLRYVWRGIAPLEPSIESLETNPQFNQVIAPTETVILVNMSVTLGSNEGSINLCYPFLSLEESMSNLSAQFWLSSEHAAAGSDPDTVCWRDLGPVEVEMEACLGEATVTLERLAALRAGDLLPLDRLEGEDVDLWLGDRCVVRGRPGVLGKNLAVSFSGWGGSRVGGGNARLQAALGAGRGRK